MNENLYNPIDDEQPTAEEFARNVELIREAIADMEAGDRGRPAVEVIEEMRAKYGLSRTKDTEQK